MALLPSHFACNFVLTFLLRAEDLENPAAPLGSMRKIHLRLTSESSGPIKNSSSSISTFRRSHASKFSMFAITVLPRGVQLLPCTSISVCHCVSPIDECELCCGVGRIILLLQGGGAFTGRRKGNKHISDNNHHKHTGSSLPITVRQATRIIPQVTPRIATALQILPLTKNVKSLTRGKKHTFF